MVSVELQEDKGKIPHVCITIPSTYYRIIVPCSCTQEGDGHMKRFFAAAMLMFAVNCLAGQTHILSQEGVIRSDGSVSLTLTPSGPAAVFDSADGQIRAARKTGDFWAVSAVGEGASSAAASYDDMVFAGFIRDGEAFVSRSGDKGSSWNPPEQITPYPQGAAGLFLTADPFGLYAMHLGYDRGWKQRFSYSEDFGGSFAPIGEFPGSPGYSQRAPIAALQGNLYSIYQDTHRDFAVILTFWHHAGDDWQFIEISREHSWAFFDIAADPLKPDRVYGAVVSGRGLSVFRADHIFSRSPEIYELLTDDSVIQERSRLKHAAVEVLENGTVVLLYQDDSGAYVLRSSEDRGISWSTPEKLSSAQLSGYMLPPSLAVSGNTLHGAYQDGAGGVHWWSISEEFREYLPGTDKVIQVPSTKSRFTVTLDDTTLVLFEAPETGTYSITCLTGEPTMLYLSLFETTEGDRIAHNFEGDFLKDHIIHDLQEGELYLLGIGVMDESDMGEQVHLEIIPHR